MATWLAILVPLAAAAATGGCGGPPIVQGPALSPAAPDGGTARDVAAWIPGNYSSAAQAASDKAYFDVRLHIAPIWTDRTDGPWMYVEQAMADAQDRPYRQRIYRIVPTPDDGAESVIYELPGDPLAWRGAWREPSRLNSLDPAIIVARPGCSVLLRRDGAGTVRGATHGSDCGSALRGAAYATSEVELTPTELRSWDRGYDAAGKQVWGAVKGPYRFVKEAPEAPAAPAPTAAP